MDNLTTYQLIIISSKLFFLCTINIITPSGNRQLLHPAFPSGIISRVTRMKCLHCTFLQNSAIFFMYNEPMFSSGGGGVGDGVIPGRVYFCWEPCLWRKKNRRDAESLDEALPESHRSPSRIAPPAQCGCSKLLIWAKMKSKMFRDAHTSLSHPCVDQV